MLALSAFAKAKDDPSEYVIISPKAGWTGEYRDTANDLTLGLSYSRYPDFYFGYGFGVNILAGEPEFDATARLMYFNLGLNGGPAISRKGIGLTLGVSTSIIIVGEELRMYWIDREVRISGTIFIPLWWRNGKFWDVNGAINNNVNFSMSGYH
ncbi:MAG: hypothetical protein IPO40_12290 [Fibrobacteres bacterium]|nr:hypothetical protein [Fibrobacterota bacterium]